MPGFFLFVRSSLFCTENTMSFEHPAFRPTKEPQKESSEESQSQKEDSLSSQLSSGVSIPDNDDEAGILANVTKEKRSAYTPYTPYTPKGFVDVYEEAKHLRKHSGKAAMAFIMTFLVLYGAGSYAEIVEAQRMNPVNWGAMTDSLEFGSNFIVLDKAASEAPSFLERFGLKILAALGSIGFFVFAAGAVAEISFRAYEGQSVDSYEVLDSLSKTHGTKLLRLGLFFMFLLLAVGLVNIGLTIDPSDFRFPFFVFVILLAQYYILLRTIFAVHSMIGEDLTPMEALHRSWEITDGNVMRLIGWGIIFSFLFFIVTFFLYILPISILTFIIVGIFTITSPSAVAEVFGILSLFILPLIARQISLIFFFQMALYRELRLRYDGIDPQEPPAEPLSVSL